MVEYKNHKFIRLLALVGFIYIVCGKLKLKFALGVGRHSIKSEPYSLLAGYSQYFNPANLIQTDSVSNRGGSIISSRGVKAATYAGFSFSDIYGALFPQICSGNIPIFVYADGSYNRTVETASLIANGLSYQCSDRISIPIQTLSPTNSSSGPGSPYRILSEGQDDNRYLGCNLAGINETYPNYGALSIEDPALSTSAWHGPQQYLEQNLFFEVKALSDAIGFSSSQWCKSNPNLCLTKSLLDVPTLFDGSYFKPWQGGWDIAKTLVNVIYYQAADGRPILNSTMSLQTVALLKKIQVQLLLSYVNDFNLHSFGVDLIAQVLGLLQQAATGQALGYSELQAPVDSSFVLLVGHDTNILSLLRWIGSDATPFGQPVNTPGFLSFLFFELWQDDESQAHFVRAIYYSPPLEALRDLADPRSLPLRDRWTKYRSVVPIRGCPTDGRGFCPFASFKSLILNAALADRQPMRCMSSQSFALLTALANPVCLYGSCFGGKVCQEGTTCQVQDSLYSQCLEPATVKTDWQCVPTLGWGCFTGGKCCNPAAVCNSAGLCVLPSQCKPF